MSEEPIKPVILNIDGYDVKVTLYDMDFHEEPISEEDDEVVIGSIGYDFEILYEFEDQEAYESIHRFINKKLPDHINQWIKEAIAAMIKKESNTESST